MGKQLDKEFRVNLLMPTYCPATQEVKTIDENCSVTRYVRNIFLQNYAENVAGRLVLDLFLFLEKDIYEVKTSSLHLNFNIFL